MALVSGRRSTLNPNAPLYVPASMRQVEDFSQEWWDLVTTSTWFRDYWLSQNQEEDFFGHDEEDEFDGNDIVDLLPDSIDVGLDEDVLNMETQFEEFLRSSEAENENIDNFSAAKTLPNNNGYGADVDALVKTVNFSKGRGLRYGAEPMKHLEKPAKRVSPKCSPRFIQQPR